MGVNLCVSELAKATGKFRPNVINATINSVEGYHTNDILKPHPTREGLWTVIGRADDQIVHSTGEKTNPGPLGLRFFGV